VYLNEQRFNDGALFPFLATALFGLERTDYWHQCLGAAAEPEAASVAERAQEIELECEFEFEFEFANLARHINRQLLNSEADDVTACAAPSPSASPSASPSWKLPSPTAVSTRLIAPKIGNRGAHGPTSPRCSIPQSVSSRFRLRVDRNLPPYVHNPRCPWSPRSPELGDQL
jgi:hypothetical protein